MLRDIPEIAANFAIDGQYGGAEPLGGGHINDSYRLTYRSGATTTRYLLQRINDAVFPEPPRLMENIQRVTQHLARRLRSHGVPDVDRRVLTLIPARDGACFCRDPAGAYWRLYRFIEGTRVHLQVTTPAQAEQAGRAFGEFLSLLADLPGPRLHETIPHFHDSPLRYAALDQAVQADAAGRAASVAAELEFAERRRALADVLLDAQRRGALPERVVHNDAKISNVLLDAVSGAGLCVVDLDIVMPGSAPYDFGDMVRSMTSPTAEDETDLSRIEVQMPLFAGLARGYLAAAGALLTAAEREHLVFGGKLITLEQGVRFLTDYLDGDKYYKTQRADQNLDRCRAQFKLVESIEQHEKEMALIV